MDWRSVEDKLPKDDQEVLTFSASGRYCVRKFYERYGGWKLGYDIAYDITHWMPLSAPEKED